VTIVQRKGEQPLLMARKSRQAARLMGSNKTKNSDYNYLKRVMTTGLNTAINSYPTWSVSIGVMKLLSKTLLGWFFGLTTNSNPPNGAEETKS